MAAEYLREGRIALRTFPDVLRSVCIKPDLQQILTDAFQAASPDSAPASVARKVRNWLNGQNKPTSREDVYIISFALGLSEGQTGGLLGFCTDYGIHYREPRDLVYAWFLRTGRTYAEAKAFLETLPPPQSQGEPQAGQNETQMVQSKHIFLQTEEELRQFYLDNRITVTYSSPSMLRMVGDPGPTIRQIQIGGEGGDEVVLLQQGEIIIERMFHGNTSIEIRDRREGVFGMTGAYLRLPSMALTRSPVPCTTCSRDW